MVDFIFVKSWQKMLFLAAEIDFLEQNCVQALELSLGTMWHTGSTIDSLLFFT